MTNIVGISGSLRRRSHNTALLHAAADMMPADATLTILSIADFPLYNEDIEAEGIPATVAAVKDAIAGADGVILATPEYNHSIPGVLKNAIDWCSRPSRDSPRVFAGRPFALIGATPGGFGTMLGQNAWLPVLRALKTSLWTGDRLMIAHAHSLFDAEGRLTDEATKEKLRAYIEAFIASVRG